MSNNNEILILNLDKVHTTEMGVERIKRNLSLENEDVVDWCKQKIKNPNSSIIRKGKNWYVTIDKIIKGFCDSPYISMHNYAETLHELIEMFYYYKNETLDLSSDDELIYSMKQGFDGVCQGSLELLSGLELSKMAQKLRYGYGANYSEDESIGGDEGDNYGEY